MGDKDAVSQPRRSVAPYFFVDDVVATATSDHAQPPRNERHDAPQNGYRLRFGQDLERD